ncbi:TonB-dependent receptor [Alteraurantiacibacter aquimixticola]|uniref:TonB-dependent receptor n=1 Tax=Alteraurantiacibacter aquimixticola TaxID=2489173 RepID=A0A4T3F3A1_9SPHN|nr:TonB-dependent receptor [Alteraurantiacibacter aquimixticola]TIX51736.1 TonB-dependent receptor [Alteraurantiacibacter aquimixticola]
MNRQVLRSGISAVAMLVSLPVMAQESAGEASDDVIVIEATIDAASSVLEFPGAVTAVDAEALEARQFRDLTSLSYAAPNVQLETVGTFKGVSNFAIRGLGVNSSIPSIDPAVGLFVDGVYMGLNAGSVFDTVDLAQIDILRGPQGTSFGQNTTGGAVMVQTADPTEHWEGFARIGYEGPVDSGRGTGMLTARGAISGPITDGLSFRVAALKSDDNGYFTNQFDGESYGAANTTVLRGGLKYDKGPLEITGKLEWMESTGDGAATHNNGLFARDTFEISVNQRGFNDSENLFGSLRAELDLGAGKLTNIFGWRDYRQATRNDIDSSPTPIFQSDTVTEQEQWSNELSYAVETGPLRLVAGGYLFHQQIGYDEQRDLSFFGAAPQFGGGRQDHDVYGLFGQVDFDVSEILSLKAGLRWSREEKAADITYVRTRPACSVIAGTCPFTGERVPGENNGFSDERSWENFSPRLVATLRASEDANIYLGWSRGHRSGGYNFRITQPDAFEEVSMMLGSPAFDRELVDSFELGAKWQSPDGLVFLQGALFWMEVDNIQREVVLPSITAGLAQSIYNTADARIKGLELEAAVEPADGLSLTANLGFTDADYTRIYQDLSGDNVIDAADLALELPRAPRWTYGGSASYDVALSDTKVLTANIFYQHRSRYAYTDNNWGFNYASDMLDASLSVGCTECGVTLTVFARNLLDEVQFGADAGLPFAGGPFSDGDDAPFDPAPNAGTFSPINKGRVLGVELGYEF